MNNPLSRRHFLKAAGAGSVFIPSSVKGYTGKEMRRLVIEGEIEADISKWEFDTPALIVDLDALEGNLATMQNTLARN